MPNGIPVIFEDDSFLVLDKPPGIVVTPEGFTKEETISEILQKDFNIDLDRGGVVHRLDKDTSGILLVAKTQPVLENLKQQFQSRTVKKKYVCLVHGILNSSGEVNASILRNPKNRLKFDIFEGGRQSLTAYEPQKNLFLSDGKFAEIFATISKRELKKLMQMGYQNYTLLNCFPKTGRTHQIRVHLKYINHPIVSDMKYGGRINSRYDTYFCPRQFLHAQEIEFNHPKSNVRMGFKSPLPADLKKVLIYFDVQ